MTSNRSRSAAAALVAMTLLAGCEAATPTPSAVAVPSPSPSSSADPPQSSPTAPVPTPSPAPEAQAYATWGRDGGVLFAPDGRIVLVTEDLNAGRSQVVTLDADGAVLPGWPWSNGVAGSPIATAALGPERSVYVAVRSGVAGTDAYRWDLHRVGIDGTELPGFPVPLAPVPFCAIASTDDGALIAACEDQDVDTGASVSTFTRVRPDGSTAPGWPITQNGSASIEGFLPGGALVVWLSEPGRATVLAIRPDGSAEPGWPIAVPEDAGSVTVDDAGRVRITSWAWSEGQCGPATGTTYAVHDAAGTELVGWPVTVKGWASEPLVAADGSMTVVTGGSQALRYGLDGQPADDWTVSPVAVSEDCYGGSRPIDAGGGATLVVAPRATLLDASGAVAAGWPVDLGFEVARACHDCTPGPSAPLAPAVGSEGIYIAAYGPGPRVVSLARDGTRIPDEQRIVGKEGDVVTWIKVAPSGRVWILLERALDEGTSTLLVPLAQDGVPAG
jgi:hypothetical protein